MTTAIAVKPLQWRDDRTDKSVFSVVQCATILGADGLIGLEYTILGPDRHSLFEVILGDKIINSSNSEEQAKAAAQADYERRVLSALTPHGEEAAGPAPVSHLVGAEPAAWGHYAADRKTLLNVFYAEPESYTAYPGEVIVPLRPDFSGVASPSPQSREASPTSTQEQEGSDE